MTCSPLKNATELTLSIIDSRGDIVARSRNPETYVGKQVPASILEFIRSKSTLPVDLPTIEGTAFRAVFLSLSGWGWSIGVGAPAEHFEQKKTRLIQLLALLGFALAAAGFVVAMAMSSQAPRDPADASVAVFAPSLFKGSWPAIVALLLVVAIGVFLAFSTQSGLMRLQERADHRLRASNQRAQLAATMSMIKDLETGARGFVMTGIEEFMEPYNAVSTQNCASA
ncbi:MAG: CHASE3 domain-containing protein [Betaproteobacteria bacterium]|nr:CHASE3 domain-containing protein [Betaproteobacteria bacterium]